MKTISVLLLALISALVTVSVAQAPAAGGPMRLEFRTIPFEGTPSPVHKVTPYRLFDKMIVTVWDPVACGQKPLDPAFSIQGDKLYLSYALSPAPATARPCTLISEFVVENLPHRDFEVAFAGGPEPYVMATLRRCPSYKPKSDDIWECLAPAQD